MKTETKIKNRYVLNEDFLNALKKVNKCYSIIIEIDEIFSIETFFKDDILTVSFLKYYRVLNEYSFKNVVQCFNYLNNFLNEYQKKHNINKFKMYWYDMGCN